MASSSQSSYSKGHVSAIAPASQAQELFSSLFMPLPKIISLPRGDSKSSELQLGLTFNSPSPINSSVRSSPSPQLSTSTLCLSDFSGGSNRSNTSHAQQDDPSQIKTPSPRGCIIPETLTISSSESMDGLEEDKKAYLPQVRDASKLLQQVLGLRNEEVFRPPTPTRSARRPAVLGSAVGFNPTLRHLRGPTAALGINIERSGSEPRTGFAYMRTDWEADDVSRRVDEGVNLREQQRLPEKCSSLRENLLLHGRQPYGNQAKTELRSITFHDLTPDMRTGEFRNVLLAHFEADQAGRTRIVSYEVDVPVNQQQPIYTARGLALPQTERWISFLISTPLVTIRSTTTITNQAAPRLPPNLHTPNGHPPTSWVIFAAPYNAITCHPPSKESVISHTAKGTETMRPIDRYDYDFSRDGIPAFEFMDKSSVLGPAMGAYLDRAVGGPFVCGKDIDRTYLPGQDFINRPRTSGGGRRGLGLRMQRMGKREMSVLGNRMAAPPGRYQCDVNMDGGDNDDDDGDDGDDDSSEDEEELAQEDERRWEDVENLDREMDNSRWWKDARDKFEEDRNTWARIKESMARGCCRIVLRVEEGAQLLQWQQQQQHPQHLQHQQQQRRRRQRVMVNLGSGDEGCG